MTRFTRAKGSKASNERVPESPTSWNTMKEQLLEKQAQFKYNLKRKEFETKRQENYDKFLKENVQNVETKWAEFPELNIKNKDVTHKVKDLKKGVIVRKNKESKVSEKKKLNKLDVSCTISNNGVENIESELEKSIQKLCKNSDINEKRKKKKIDIPVKNKRSNSEEIIDNDNSRENDSEKNCFKQNENLGKNKKNKRNHSKFNNNTELNNDFHYKEFDNKNMLNNNNSKKKTHLHSEINENTENNYNGLNENVTVKKIKKRKIDERFYSHLTQPDIISGLNNESIVDCNHENKIFNIENESKKKKNKKRKYSEDNKLESNRTEFPADENLSNSKIIKCSIENKHNSIVEMQSNTKKKNKSKLNKKSRNLNNNGSDKKTNVRDSKKNEENHEKLQNDENREYKRRKPDVDKTFVVIDGKEEEIIKFDGFPVKESDAIRLNDLKKQMISRGIPRSEVNRTLKSERRKAEKALARDRKKNCFHCRKSGHVLSDCPELMSKSINTAGTGICYKCGSTEHTQNDCKLVKKQEFKFAECFICKEQGHIARQCPDNPKGLYPQGGGCRLCGDVTHLKRDCPQNLQTKKDDFTLNRLSHGLDLESLGDETKPSKLEKEYRKKIKF